MTKTDAAIIEELKALQEFVAKEIKLLNERVDALVVQLHEVKNKVRIFNDSK